MNSHDETLPLFAANRPAPPLGPDVDLPAPSNKTATSQAAARQARANAGTQRAAVLKFLRDRGDHGGTDEEIQIALGMKVQTETPRRGELVKLRYVVNSGRVRPTSSGRAAIVWIAASPEGGADL